MFCKLCYQWKGFQRALKALNIAETNVLPEEQVIMRCSPLFSFLVLFFYQSMLVSFEHHASISEVILTRASAYSHSTISKGWPLLLQWQIQVGGGGGHPPPPIFRLNWGIKGKKNFFSFPSPIPHLNSYFSPKFTKKSKHGHWKNIGSVLFTQKPLQKIRSVLGHYLTCIIKMIILNSL